ncbi:MAG TPA: hypothetical protein VMB25_21130 [Bryobacteraceae bacterium]|nr:hypothetical protein [Bryobacteraceae bacterium]
MKSHLSSEQISEWMLGQRSARAREHVRACLECRAELERLEEALAQFRGAIHQWSGAQAAAVPPVLVTSRPRRFAWALAAVAAVLFVCLSVAYIQNRAAASLEPVSDAALLSQVRAEVSRTVPSPMEPLTRLIPSAENQ